jgi:hypothetical protein
VCVDFDLYKHNLRIIINFNVIKNFVTLFKIKKFSFQNKLSLKQELKIFNKTLLYMYYTHNMHFEISNFNDFCNKDKNQIIEINMNKIEMILKVS